MCLSQVDAVGSRTVLVDTSLCERCSGWEWSLPICTEDGEFTMDILVLMQLPPPQPQLCLHECHLRWSPQQLSFVARFCPHVQIKLQMIKRKVCKTLKLTMRITIWLYCLTIQSICILPSRPLYYKVIGRSKGWSCNQMVMCVLSLTQIDNIIYIWLISFIYCIKSLFVPFW